MKDLFIKIIKDKNTVTILGALLITSILYFNYNMQIERAISPIKVPIAKVTIDQKTKITRAMYDIVDMAPIMLMDNVIRSQTDILDKYTNYNYIVPKGSLFYKDNGLLVNSLPDSIYSDLSSTLIPLQLEVDLESTYGNSIYPNTFVDIYMKSYDENNVLMVGKLIANAKVLAVKDSLGNNVFDSVLANKIPNTLLFAFDNETQTLIRKATYLRNYGVELFPVPITGLTKEEKDKLKTTVSTEHLKLFIENQTVTLAEDDLLVTEVTE
jgi:hypothetical protein